MASQLDSCPSRRRAQATSFPRRAADDPVVLVGRRGGKNASVLQNASFFFGPESGLVFFWSPLGLKS